MPTNHQGEIERKINGEIGTVLVDTRVTLNPSMIHQELPWINKNISVMGVSNQDQRVLLAEPNCYPWLLLCKPCLSVM